MKTAIFKFSVFFIIGSATLLSCSKKAKEETREATEAIKDDIKDAAGETKKAANNVASDVKKAAKRTVTEVKEAANATASTVKKVSDDAVAILDAKLSKMSKSAREKYHALDKEIGRIDHELKTATGAKKKRLEKTRARLIKRRDELLTK